MSPPPNKERWSPSYCLLNGINCFFLHPAHAINDVATERGGKAAVVQLLLTFRILNSASLINYPPHPSLPQGKGARNSRVLQVLPLGRI